MYMMQRMRLSNLGQCMTLQKQKPRLKRKQRKRIVDSLNGNAQCMKIWHSCIMGNVVLIYLLSMGDYNYEPIGMMNVMKIVLHFLIPSFALHRLSLKHTNQRTEPKHIVFLSHLLLLFKFPCKIGTGISPRSRQDSRRSPGSRRDPAEMARFPGGILPGKNSRRVSRQESRREICTRRDPAKKKTVLQDPGENPAGKQNLDSIRGDSRRVKILPYKFPPRSCTFSLLKRISRRGCVKPDLDI